MTHFQSFTSAKSDHDSGTVNEGHIGETNKSFLSIQCDVSLQKQLKDFLQVSNMFVFPFGEDDEIIYIGADKRKMANYSLYLLLYIWRAIAVTHDCHSEEFLASMRVYRQLMMVLRVHLPLIEE